MCVYNGKRNLIIEERDNSSFSEMITLLITDKLPENQKLLQPPQVCRKIAISDSLFSIKSSFFPRKWFSFAGSVCSRTLLHTK